MKEVYLLLYSIAFKTIISILLPSLDVDPLVLFALEDFEINGTDVLYTRTVMCCVLDEHIC